jgi:hypothetical protein
MGAAFDVFGTGKTALKISLNKYLIGADGPAFTYGTQAPYGRVVHSTTRTWRDLNSNSIPECDLTSTAANGNVERWPTRTGKAGVSTTYINAVNGWASARLTGSSPPACSSRFSRASAEAGYFRRWYEFLRCTDNLAVSASDFDTFSVTAPVDRDCPTAATRWAGSPT